MRINRRYIFTFIFLLVVIAYFPGAHLRAESDKDIFDRARLALFDRQWDQALKELNRLIEMYPNTSYYPQALFYKGKCYEEKKMHFKALENYNAYLQVSRNESLKEEAIRGIIDMSFKVYEKTDNRKYLEDIVQYLRSKNEVLQYYAAFILSRAKDKTIASKAVPILKKIIAKESDQDLVDRAKIELMRIDPEHLKKLAKPKSLSGRKLVIKVVDKKSKRESFSLSIPFVLAKLAMDSLPEKEKKLLEKKGYRLEQILETIVETGEILKIESEDGIFRIWIE